MTEAKTTQLPPVYLSTKKLEDLLGIISSKNLTSIGVISPSFFSSYGITGTDSNLAISSLRFLGLLDAKSVPTPAMQKMMLKGDEPRKALEELVRTAYARLFDLNADAHHGQPDKLYNDFINVFKVSPRVAPAAVRDFILLCERAGLRDPEATAPRKERTPRVSRPVSPKPRREEQSPRNRSDIASQAGQAVVPFAGGEIALAVPTKVFASSALLEAYGTVSEAVRVFAEAYITHEHDGANGAA